MSDDARASLDQLGETNELGILTDDSTGWTRRLLDAHDLTHRFDAVVTATAAGAQKPASEPFELARNSLPADEYVMVGHDYERDVEGARAAGFVPIHFDGPDFWQTLRALV